MKKSRAAFAKVGWLLKKKDLKIKVKTLLYKQLIRPTMTYGVGAWGNVNERDIENLEKRERQVLRCITGMYRRENGRYFSSKDVYQAAGIKERLSEVIKKIYERYEEKKLYHLNKWYTKRAEDLKNRLLKKKVNNLEYDKQTRIWKELKKNN